MSRLFRRIRTRLTATVEVDGADGLLVCPTRNISEQGCFLDTGEPLEISTRLAIACMDNARGKAVEVEGTVTRLVADGGGIGVYIDEPTLLWIELVERTCAESGPIGEPRGVRLQVLIVGDGERRRSALALYVTSGWDVCFASDFETTLEALRGVELSAVIVEHDLEDNRWPEILLATRRIQPNARRVIRCALRGQPPPTTNRRSDLVHHVVDLDAGFDALLDVLTADVSL